MLNLTSIMVGTMQPKEMAEFYEKVFGKKADWSESNWHGWKIGSTFITIGEHSEMKGKTKDPGRVMYNFETKEVRRQGNKRTVRNGRRIDCYVCRSRWKLFPTHDSLGG